MPSRPWRGARPLFRRWPEAPRGGSMALRLGASSWARARVRRPQLRRYQITSAVSDVTPGLVFAVWGKDRGLVLVSGGQSGGRHAGLALAVRRRHAYDM